MICNNCAKWFDDDGDPLAVFDGEAYRYVCSWKCHEAYRVSMEVKA